MRFKNRVWNVLISSLLVLTAIMGIQSPMQNVEAATSDLLFSEYIEGTSNNKALEIYNGTGGDVNLSEYTVELYTNGSTTVGQTQALSGTLIDGDVYIIANSSAVTAITDVADITSAVTFYNGDDVLLLKHNGTIIDSIGQLGFDPGTNWTSNGVATSEQTLRRKSTICQGDNNPDDVFDPSVEWDSFPQDTFDGLESHTANCGPVEPQAPKINEFSASTTGTDVEFIEIYGEPDTDYSTLSVLQIEGDISSTPGVIKSITVIGTTDVDGFYLADLAVNTLENGTLTFLLVENFTGAVSDDLDTDDDGVLDVTPWDSIVDSIAVNDGGVGDLNYGLPVLTANYDGLSFTPGGASRIPDGMDTEAVTDWVRNDFDLAGIVGFPGTITLGEAYNTPGAANEIYIPPPEACGDPFTPIYDVQGNSLASPLVGTEVAIEGVVVGDFQNNVSVDSGDLNGFFVQDLTGDSDLTTSDGIFVYASGAIDLSVGDEVRVRGSVSEYHNQTEITASQIWQCSFDNLVPNPIELSLPLTNVEDLETFEGVLVNFPQTLTISEYYNFGRYNEIVLTTDRYLTPTAEFEPGPDAIAAAENFLLNKITLDDGRSSQNSDPAIHPDGNVFDLTNLFRGGDTVANITGFMDQYDSAYRVQPIQGADYTQVNVRPVSPVDVGGNIKVASFNVLNYFTTLDAGSSFWICGPSQDMECRGADTADEFTRQRAKIIAAISAIDADVVGLMEIENNINDDAVIDLVAGLNDALGAGTYDYVATGAIGTDAIKVALIYKPASVTLIGSYAVLDTSVDSRFLDDKNRPTLAQTFQDAVNGGYVTVAVNHLKSKGSDCLDVGDPDLGDGAGNCNLTRKAAAEALVDWLAADPTGSGDGDYLIIGDLNSYDKEDPIDAILKGPDDVLGTLDDYTDMIYTMVGEDAYSYVFDGQTGYLDHALANAALVPQITGTTIWHINADEPSLIDYDMSFKLPAQDALYAPDAYRSSDHDPVIIGLDLTPFSMTPVEVSETVLPGEQVKIPITISNHGFTTDTYDIVRLPDTLSISIGFPTVVGPLNPGESITFDATVVVTENEPFGSSKTYVLQGTSREHSSSLTSTINILVDYLRIYFPLIFK